MECWILALPILLISLLVVAIVLVCFKKWKWAVGVLVVAIVVNCYGEVLALHPLRMSGGTEADIKVMAFNIHGSGEDFESRTDGIVRLIREENPDVVFVSELFTPYRHYDEQLDSMLRCCYPYSSFEKKSIHGNAFYSKLPVDTLQMLSISLGKSQSLAMIRVKGQRVGVLGCHLSSNNYVDSQTKVEVDSVTTKSDVKRYLQTIEKGYRSRRQDVDSLALQLAEMDMSHLITLGDMNDIGGSYTIRAFEAMGLKDAWWKGGFGMGGTRNVLGFRFRIDHILYGKGFDLKDVKVVNADGLSDHDAVVARFCVR